MRSGAGEGREGRSTGIEDATSMRRFLEMSVDLLAVVDLQTTILEASQSWRRTLGWDPDTDLIGTPLIAYFHDDDLPRIEAELAGLLVGGEALNVVVQVRHADGSYRWVQGNATADLDAERIYVTAADITASKAIEDALRAQLSLEEVVASMTARFIGGDDEEMPRQIERGLGELGTALGADRAHFLRGSRRPGDLLLIEWLHPDFGQRHHTPDPSPSVQRWWRDALRAGRLVQLRDVDELADEAPEVVAALHAEGVRSVLLVPLPFHRRFWGFLALVSIREHVLFSDDATSLLRLAGEAFMSALARSDDEAALLDARRELEHRNEELERSNEELERFAYAAAHDLKAPLSRVEMALAATPTPEGDAGELLQVARRGAGRLRQLIEDLLAFSAVGNRQGAPEPVDLDDVLDQVLSDLEPAIGAAGAEIERGRLPAAWGHPLLLAQLLQNLLANALKFTRPGVAPVIGVEGTSDDDGITLRITDNGIGIDAAHRSDVFSVFTRLNSDDQYPGSGIGLATCAKVVAHHEGRIWVEDGVDGGTAVVVELPHRPDPT